MRAITIPSPFFWSWFMPRLYRLVSFPTRRIWENPLRLRFDGVVECSVQRDCRLAFCFAGKGRREFFNPFEGGSNDVPISFIARKIELEMRAMLGEQTNLKPIEAKHSILF
jgi:hypothetical protein